MNEHKIDELADRFKDCWAQPVLPQATRLLKRFMRLINQKSDGWAHWPLAAKGSSKLVELVQQAEYILHSPHPGISERYKGFRYNDLESGNQTLNKLFEQDFKAAVTQIKGFCTRHKFPMPPIGEGLTRNEFLVKIENRISVLNNAELLKVYHTIFPDTMKETDEGLFVKVVPPVKQTT